MKQISLKAHAKINPSLDVLTKRPDGYHEVRLIMQLIELHDLIFATWEPAESPGDGETARLADDGGPEIRLTCDSPEIPCDESNLAWKAVRKLAERMAADGKPVPKGRLQIHIEKHIPVAAGLAGGSADGAACLLAGNALFEAGYNLSELLGTAAALGADVPFALMGAAYANPVLGFAKDPLAAPCALGEGTGTVLTVLPPADAHILLAKPPIGVSTAAAYSGIDALLAEEAAALATPAVTSDSAAFAAALATDPAAFATESAAPAVFGDLPPRIHPDIDAVILALNKHDIFSARSKMGNTLELYTLKKYHEVKYTKCKIQEHTENGAVLMSGSGPTVFLLARTREETERVYDALAGLDARLILTRTVV